MERLQIATWDEHGQGGCYGLNNCLWTRARPDKAERETFLELHNKHETARLKAIGRKATARLQSRK